MGKGRKNKTPKFAQGPYRDDHPGSDGKADAPPPVEKTARPSRTAEFRMILDDSVATVLESPSSVFTHDRYDAAQMTTTIVANDDHPLAGLSPQRRTQDRVDAIALILARLAIKAISKGSEVSDEQDAD
jgi:hypothetical protein